MSLNLCTEISKNLQMLVSEVCTLKSDQFSIFCEKSVHETWEDDTRDDMKLSTLKQTKTKRLTMNGKMIWLKNICYLSLQLIIKKILQLWWPVIWSWGWRTSSCVSTLLPTWRLPEKFKFQSNICPELELQNFRLFYTPEKCWCQ